MKLMLYETRRKHRNTYIYVRWRIPMLEYRIWTMVSFVVRKSFIKYNGAPIEMRKRSGMYRVCAPLDSVRARKDDKPTPNRASPMARLHIHCIDSNFKILLPIVEKSTCPYWNVTYSYVCHECEASTISLLYLYIYPDLVCKSHIPF